MHLLLTLVLVLAAAVAGAAWWSLVFPLQPHHEPLPGLTAEERALAAQSKAHIKAIASGPHNVAHHEALEAAARYIETALESFGHKPLAHGFLCDGKPVRNIEVVIEPASGRSDAPSFVIGAHYDSADVIPGANDNGTGVAAALEIARLLRDWRPSRHRLRIVFWVNEEMPYGKTEMMGSLRHARGLKEQGEHVTGMIALETIGYFSSEAGSQKFPAPFGLVYPDTGNFIAFVGLPKARALVHRTLASFRRQTQFPSIGGVAPGFLEGIDLSDHWAYDHVGYPALMVTDTAPFRNPYYHVRGDLPHTVDYDSLARVTAGLVRMLREVVD